MALAETPVSYYADHNTRTVFTTARGVLQIQDILAHARELAKAGLFAYSQLIDAREACLKISPSDVEPLVSLNKELRRIHGNAKTAFVTKRTADFGMMRMYELKIGDHDSGFAAFYDINQAVQWILS